MVREVRADNPRALSYRHFVNDDDCDDGGGVGRHHRDFQSQLTVHRYDYYPICLNSIRVEIIQR